MKLAVARLAIRSNSFTPSRTRSADVLSLGLASGTQRLVESGVPEFVGLHMALAALPGWRAELVRSLAAPTAGPLSGSLFESWLHDVESASRSGRVDAVYLALSGACQAEGDADADLTVLRRVRAAARRLPVVASFAVTANIGEETTYLLDGACGWRGEADADGADAAVRAIRLLAATLSGAARPVAALVKLPSLLSSVALRSRLSAECWGRLAPEPRPQLLDASAFAGFAWADCAHAGAAAMVWTDRDTGLAREVAAELAGRLAALVPPSRRLPTVAEAVAAWRRAGASPPLALLDVADDPVRGGLLDTPGLLADLLAVVAADPSLGGDAVLVCGIHDPELARRAVVGAESIQVTLGGGLGRQFGRAVSLNVLVVGAHGGSALLRAGGLLVLVTSERQGRFAPADLDALAVGRDKVRILAVKGGDSLRPALVAAGYGVVDVGCPGPAQHDLEHLPYRTVPAGRRQFGGTDPAQEGWPMRDLFHDPRRASVAAAG